MERNIERYRMPVISPFLEMEPFSLFPGRRGLLENMLDTGFSFSGLSDLFDSDFGVKVVDREDHKEYQFGLPGIKKENISIDVSGNILTVKVDQQDEQSSRVYSSKVTLGPDLDVEHATAESQNGLLSVSFPYMKQSSYKVAITSNEENESQISLSQSGGEEMKHLESSETTADSSVEGMAGTEEKAEAQHQI